jgi:hypothetical protein
LAEYSIKGPDAFHIDDGNPHAKVERSYVLQKQIVDIEKNYQVDDQFREAQSVDEVHTIAELIKYAEEGKIEIDARVIGLDKDGNAGVAHLDTKEFVEAHRNPKAGTLKLRESVDTFNSDGPYANLGKVGNDFTPLLGGPFYKQLYYYDYMRMHSAAFYAYNHDPLARAIVSITRDFTLGRGWRADSSNKAALALWEAFADANDLYNKVDHIAVELAVYGETMIWWLPDNETKITYNLGKGQTVPRGLIPRIRLIDPSCIWDIITYPEDITRVLAYQWVAPTQYQIYTKDNKTGTSVPSSKFIYQQIPSDQVMHFKVNSVSNEKRGRSDLFPILGYLKRLRDSVNYGIIALQKNMAWSIDTTVEGSQSDLNAYVMSQQEIGTIPPAGSEFVHSKKVERKYLSNEGGRGQGVQIFEWCMSCIAAGSGIPVNYFGSHLGGGGTRASALVATEPVTKKFEKRQLVYQQMLDKMAKRLFKMYGIEADIEFTFPELVSQDRSAKLKDMALAELQGWISREKLAPIAAKELGIDDYDPDVDMGISEQAPLGGASPLSTPPALDAGDNPKPSAVTGEERAAIAKQES